ncbi:hypothetical protein DIPPA_31281 [Diplonema papillatum]|nr:hypothetical protein DIPPA_31281 [Diplonema papillatum]
MTAGEGTDMGDASNGRVHGKWNSSSVEEALGKLLALLKRKQAETPPAGRNVPTAAQVPSSPDLKEMRSAPKTAFRSKVSRANSESLPMTNLPPTTTDRPRPDSWERCSSDDMPRHYASYAELRERVVHFYDEETDAPEGLLSWYEKLPARWASSGIPPHAFNRTWKQSPSEYLKYGGCRFYSEDLWCRDGRHYSRCINGNPTCCFLRNFSNVVSRILSKADANVPWAALEAMGPDKAVEGILACFLYTYNTQVPNPDDEPQKPRGRERPLQIYSAVNLAMRTMGDAVYAEEKHSASELAHYRTALDIFRPLIRKLDLFLRALPREPKVVFRGLSGHRVSQQYKRGSIVAWSGFTSTSDDGAVAWWFTGDAGGTWFAVRADAQCAADISWTSMYPTEREQLMPCNTFLEVADRPSEAVIAALRTPNDVVILSQAGADTVDDLVSVKKRYFADPRESFVVYRDFASRFVEPDLAEVPHASVDDRVKLFPKFGLRPLESDLNDVWLQRHGERCETGCDRASEALADASKAGHLSDRVMPEETTPTPLLNGANGLRKILLSGDSGCGKTSSVLALYTAALQQGVMALIYSLPAMSQTDIISKKSDLAADIRVKCPAGEEAWRYIQQGRFFIILDALDECSGDPTYLKEPGGDLLSRLNFVEANWPQAIVIVTARTEYLDYYSLTKEHIFGENAEQYYIQGQSIEHTWIYLNKVAAMQTEQLVIDLHTKGWDRVRDGNNQYSDVLLNDLFQETKSKGVESTIKGPTASHLQQEITRKLQKLVNRLHFKVSSPFQLSMAVEAGPGLTMGDGRWGVYTTWCHRHFLQKAGRYHVVFKAGGLHLSLSEQVDFLEKIAVAVGVYMHVKGKWHESVGTAVSAVGESLGMEFSVLRSLLTCLPLRLEDPDDLRSSFSFVHRSIHEYFLARGLLCELLSDKPDMTKTVAAHVMMPCTCPLVLEFFGEAVRSLLMGVPEAKARARKVLYNLRSEVKWVTAPPDVEESSYGPMLLSANCMSLLVAAGIDMVNCDFRNVSIPCSKLFRGHFRGCDFRGSDLRGTDLRQADLTDCDFRGSVLDDRPMSQWSVPLRTGLQPMIVEHSVVTALTWHPTEPDTIAVVTDDAVIVYCIERVVSIARLPFHHLASVAWEPLAGKALAIASTEGHIILWSPDTERIIPVPGSSLVSGAWLSLAWVKVGADTSSLFAAANKTLYSWHGAGLDGLMESSETPLSAVRHTDPPTTFACQTDLNLIGFACPPFAVKLPSTAVAWCSDGLISIVDLQLASASTVSIDDNVCTILPSLLSASSTGPQMVSVASRLCFCLSSPRRAARSLIVAF